MKKKVVGIVGGTVIGFIGGAMLKKRKECTVVKEKDKKIDKFKQYYNLLNQWVALKIAGKNLEEFFENNGYKRIGIYGMGELGNRLYEELEYSSVEIVYTADESPKETFSKTDVVEIENMTNDVDVVIVTAIFAMDSIETVLSKRLDCSIISLENVIYEL